MNKILLDIPETIETSRLVLRMPQAGDGPAVHAAIMDGYEDYAKWLSWPQTPPTQEAVELECRKGQAEFILRDFVRYVIFEKDTGMVVGRCAFPPFQTNWAIPQFGISYFIRKNKRGNGYATEAAHALVVIAFKVFKARKVEIYCDAANKASIRIPDKLGFTLEYTQRGGWLHPDGELAQLQTYSLFSPDALLSLELSWK